MTDQIQATNRLGPIRQSGYVVNDMDKALAHWTTVLGVGPFYYIESVELDWFRHRGVDQSPQLSIALGNSGHLQIELICQRDETPTTYREFLESGEEGLQHIAYWTTEYQSDRDELLAAGHRIGQEGQIQGPDGRFAYFDTNGHRGTVMELSDVSGSKGECFERLRGVAQDWDGSRPVRKVG